MLAYFIKNLIDKFVKKLSILVLCNALTQVVSIVGFIFISRIYAVAEIGEYLIYVAFVALLSVCATGNYEQAIFVEKREHFLEKIVSLCIVFCLIFLLLVFLVLVTLDIEHAHYIIIAVLAAALMRVGISINIAKDRLVFNALYALVVSPILPILIVINGNNFSPDAQAIIAIHSLTMLLTSLLFFSVSAKYSLTSMISGYRKYWLQVLALSKRYRKFPQFSMPGELIGSSSMRIPIFIANEYFSKQMAAYYGVVLRIAITPVSIILANVAQIFLHQVSSNYKNGLPSFVIFIKYFCGLFLVGLMGCVLVVAYGEDLIVLVLGNKYETVGILLVDILPYIFMLAVVSPLTSVLYIFEKQNYLFYNESAFFLATLVCFGYGAYIEDFFVGARLYAIFMAIIYTVIFLEIFIILYKDKQLRGKV